MPSSSSPCTRSAGSTRPTARCSKDITLSFYPGAKIGVLGANGVGQVVAAADHGRASTTATPARPGSRPASPSACSSRSRTSTRPRTSSATSWTASARRPRCSTATTRCCAEWADPDADYEKLGERAGRARGQDRGRRRLGPRAHHRDRHGRAAPARRATPTSRRCPAASAAGSRCAGCCCRAPTCCCSTSPPTTSTPSRSAWLERFLQDYHGTVVAITHDRYFLDNVAGWILELDRGRGIPFEGNYSRWLEQKQERLAPGGEGRLGPPAHPRSASSSGCAWRPRPARPRARPASPPTRSCSPRPKAADGAADKLEISIPPGERLGDVVIEAEHLAQGLRRPAAHRRPVVHAAAGRHRRRHRRRTAPARPRCSGCSPAQEQPDDGALQRRPDGAARLRRPEPRQRSTPTRPSTRRSPAASTT